MILTLEDILRHTRIEEGVEDEYLQSCGESAEDMILRYLGRTEEELIETYGKVPQAVKHACLLVTAGLYKNREPENVQNSSQNKLFIPLIIKYRKL